MSLHISASSLQLRDITYPHHPYLHDYTLDDNLPTLQSLPTPKKPRELPKARLGVLSRLPLELLHIILFQVDIFTLLLRFRHVNRGASQVIETGFPFTVIMKYAYNALWGILAIGTGRWITCQVLYDKLCTAQCEECGDFGGYLYLLTCSRVCFLCLSESKRYLPLTYRDAIRKYGINTQIIRGLPHMKCVPGLYSKRQVTVAKPLALVDAPSARAAGIERHGSVIAVEDYVFNALKKRMEAYWQRKVNVTRTSTFVRLPREPRTKDKYDGQAMNPLRSVSIVCVPSLDRISGEVELGFHCAGCRYGYERPKHWRRKYTRATFIKHLEECGEIRNESHHTPEAKRRNENRGFTFQHN